MLVAADGGGSVLGVLSGREWATVAWLVVFTGFCLYRPDIRKSFAAVVSSATDWRLLVLWSTTTAYFVGVLFVAARVGLWKSDLLKDAIVWFVTSGIGTGFIAANATKPKFSFRQYVLGLLGITAILQFVLNLGSFPFLVELILQPFLALLVVVSAFAATKPEHRSAKSLADWLLIALVAVALFASVRQVVNDWERFDADLAVRQFAFSVWVPLAMLPFIYVVALVLLQGTVISLMRVRQTERLPRSVRWEIPLGTRLRLTTLRELRKDYQRTVAFAREPDRRKRLAILREVRRGV